MQASGVIALSVVDGLLATIDAEGIDSAALSARVGLADGTLFEDPSFRPLATFTSLLEIAAVVRDDPVLGFRLGKAFDFRRLGPMGELFLTAPTVGDALYKFTCYFPVLQSNTQCSLGVDNETARLSYLITDSTIRHRAQDANFTEIVFCSMLAALLGEDWRPSSVHFEHSPGAHIARYRPYLACDLRFGERENAILFPARQLDVPIRYSDRNAHSHVETEIRELRAAEATRLDVSASIKAWITAALANSADIEIGAAASDFGMSLRSFQRKLFETGVNYAHLRNCVRIGLARSLLGSTELPIPAIAEYLKYSETSAFSRSFKHLAGETPARFREQARRSGRARRPTGPGDLHLNVA
jgi:AraC-like DNA-binding protein